MRWIIALCVLAAIPGPWLAAASNDPCRLEGTTLIVERGGRLALVDPGSLTIRDVPVDSDGVALAGMLEEVLNGLRSPRWQVARTADEETRRIEVIDSRDGSLVFDVSFTRRIELAATSVSPSHRFVVRVQSNNVASEVTILDAQARAYRFVTIPHGAVLAAYAIGIAFSPEEGCAAISMERAGGGGAETWLIDLDSGALARLPVENIFALIWI